jgi:EAL domain-containing protein (putative c-di-GMP-specific phosphodiesterase class I)
VQHELLALHFQPKVNMRSGELMGVEALIRWKHPERGLLAPGQFLPEIENHSVIAEIGEWVIAAALAQLAAWQRQGLRTRVSVNIAGHHLQQSTFVARLQTLLAAVPEVQASQLELEVLESSALGDLAYVSHIMAACNTMGVSFSIDDFGTGYSSLTYLKRLDAREIKVDQSFVREMLDDPENLAILEGVLGLARAFRRSLIAEGVETVAHGETLLRLGCELGQGYGIARPMPAELLPHWAAHWRPDARWSVAGHLDQDGRAQLYALVEHRAWIGEVLSALAGHSNSMPALDLHQCRCGQWLDAQARRGELPSPSWDRFERIHEETHGLALALYEEQLAGRQAEMLERLPILYARRDELLSMLSSLPAQPGYPLH